MELISETEIIALAGFGKVPLEQVRFLINTAEQRAAEKLRIATEALEFVRENTLYFDYNQDALNGCYRANSDNVVGQAVKVQLVTRAVLEKIRGEK